MAKPIKETPVLKGKDAKVFVMNNKAPKKESDAELAKIKQSYEALKSIATFAI